MTEQTGAAGPSDGELVAAVLAADREAFAAMYDRHGGKLYDYAYSMLRQREDAADAVADSFVIVAERLAQLRDGDRLRPWLYAIVRSECLRRLKARSDHATSGSMPLEIEADDEVPDTGLELATPEQQKPRPPEQPWIGERELASAGFVDTLPSGHGELDEDEPEMDEF